jgi:hypothetical protein
MEIYIMADSITLNKKMLPSEPEMIRNLLTWYALAQSNPFQLAKDTFWYPTALEDCKRLQEELEKEQIALDLFQVITVVAIVSPAMKWELNVESARHTILAWYYAKGEVNRKAEYMKSKIGVGRTWQNIIKAWNYLDGNIQLTDASPKTFRFADNIANGDLSQFATIDQHMIHIICDTKMRGSISHGSYYLVLERVVILVATMLGLPVSAFQAILWGCRVSLFESGHDVSDIYSLIASLGNAE